MINTIIKAKIDTIIIPATPISLQHSSKNFASIKIIGNKLPYLIFNFVIDQTISNPKLTGNKDTLFKSHRSDKDKLTCKYFKKLTF